MIDEVEGLGVAGCYEPGSVLADIGAGWYAGPSYATGGSPSPSAAAMGQLRTAARAYALDAPTQPRCWSR